MEPENPTLCLSRLRDIGWKIWDPIGLLAAGDTWKDEPFADEYDTYLVRAAEMIRQNEPSEDVITYIMDIETNYMGLGTASHDCAKRLVDAIQADDLLWSPAHRG